jgi:3-oxoacyl-[acyl-carrier-protein] synthase-3
VADRINVSMDNAVITLDRYGNTSSSSIPLAFDIARKEGRIKKGEYALLTGFGAGMTWASAIIKWS